VLELSIFLPLKAFISKSATIDRKLRPPTYWQPCTRLINHK